MDNNTQDLGMIAYEQGDFARAFEHWQKLAKEEHKAQAMFNLAILYTNGEGVAHDLKEARFWSEAAAKAGLADAQHYLGALCHQEDKLEDAVKWWQQAAEQDYAPSQNHLAWAYHQGQGVPQDNELAADWFEAAARQNHPDACFNLGVLYANGQRFQHARYWWQKAASLQYQDAINALKTLDEMGV